MTDTERESLRSCMEASAKTTLDTIVKQMERDGISPQQAYVLAGMLPAATVEELCASIVKSPQLLKLLLIHATVAAGVVKLDKEDAEALAASKGDQ